MGPAVGRIRVERIHLPNDRETGPLQLLEPAGVLLGSKECFNPLSLPLFLLDCSLLIPFVVRCLIVDSVSFVFSTKSEVLSMCME